MITRDIYFKSKRKDPIVAYIVAYVLKLQKNADAFIFFRNTSIHCLNVNMILKCFE